MKKTLVSLFFLLTISSLINAQSILWTDLLDFSSDSDEMGNDISLDSSNNAYVVGYGVGASSYDALAVKYDVTTGDTLWASLHDVSAGSFEIIYGSTLYNQGNLFSTGYIQKTTNDILLIKYDNATGVVLWDKSYDFGGNDMGMECDIDDSNNIFIAVQCDSQIGYMECRAANGDTLKTHLIDFPLSRNANVYGIICGDYGEIYLSGYVEESADSYGIFVMKYNVFNDSILYIYESQNYIDNLSDAICGISIDSEKNIYCSGNAGELFNQEYGVTFKIDSMGDSIWERTYKNSNDRLYKNAISSDGFLYACGAGYNSFSDDYLLIKYNTSTGESLQVLTLDSGLGYGIDEYSYGIGVCEDNNVIMTGVADWDEVFTIKVETNMDGVEEQVSKNVITENLHWFNCLSYETENDCEIKVELIDLSGRIVSEKHFIGSMVNEDFNNLSAGNYIVKIQTRQKSITGKFTKF